MAHFIKLLPRETWDFIPSRYPDVRITYRRLTLEAIEAINQKFRKVDPRSRQEFIPAGREARREAEFRDYVIVDWSGVVGPDDQPLSCSLEAKVTFCEQYPETWQELLRVAQSDLADEADGRPEALSPNS